MKEIEFCVCVCRRKNTKVESFCFLSSAGLKLDFTQHASINGDEEVEGEGKNVSKEREREAVDCCWTQSKVTALCSFG